MSLTTSPAQTSFATARLLGSRTARPIIDALLSDDAAPRVLISGPAGSGKTALLRAVHRFLSDRGTASVLAGPGTDIAAVPIASVLLVDDLQLLHPAQLEALSRRTTDLDAALVAAARPWPVPAELSAVVHLLERSRPTVVLGRVTRADVLDHLDDAIAPECLDHILTVTAGTSWLVSAALAAHDERDCTSEGHEALDEVLRQHVHHRLTLVDADARHATEQVSLAVDGGSRIDPARGSQTHPTGLAGAHAAGMLLHDGRVAPIVRDTVVATLPAARLAETTDAALRRARAAWASGDIDEAGRLVDAARTASERTAEVDAGLADVAAATWSMRGMMHTGRLVYDALPESDHASTGEYIARVAVGDPDVLHPRADAGTLRPAPPSTVAVATELLRRGLRASLSPVDAGSAVADLVRASHLFSVARAASSLPEVPAIVAAAAAGGAGELDVACGVLDTAIAEHSGTGWMLSRLLLWRSFVALQQARGGQSREFLAASLELAPSPAPRDELMAQAIRIGLARRYGDTAALAEAWARGRDSLLEVDVDLFTILPLTEFVSTGARLGDEAATRPQLVRALEIVRSLGWPPLWAAHLHWAGIQTGILGNRPDSLAPYAHALVEASGTSAVAATMARAGRIWTAVLAGSVHADEVEAAARGLAAIGLPWDAARLAGQSAQLADDRKVSARLLACAREVHPQENSRGPEQAPQTATTSPVAGPASLLSERETDVARLVVEGKTYAEIGEIIFISPRTAEHHIASIRRRLSATSRSDLISKLRVALGLVEPRTGQA